ncbi:MAG TPA: hypothetical protein V6C58_14610 [Allocoleopsis sp.]
MERLTVDEQQRFWKALDEMEKANEKIEKIYLLLAGDKSLHQEGLIERVIMLESEVNQMKNQMEKAKGWIAGALFVGSILGSGITLFIKYLISKI